jgi:hypothetical protein
MTITDKPKISISWRKSAESATPQWELACIIHENAKTQPLKWYT